MVKSLGALSFLSGGLLILTIVLGLIAASTIVNAEDTSVSNVSISVPVACELNADVEEAHNATINPGTYEDEIGTTTFTVFCNDNSGFSIYAVGYSGDTFGNNKLLATIGGTLNPTYDIITGTGTDATTSGGVSNWAMKINKVTGTYAPTITGETQGDTEDFTDYHIVPDTYTKVATLTSNTDATIGSKLQSTYAAYISGTQPAGTYNGKVKYTLVYPNDATPQDGPQDCPANYICYFPGANGVIGVMDTRQTISSNFTDHTLWASNFSREGYGFAGWSDKFDWVINANDANGNGAGVNAGYHIYGPNATISLTTADYSSPNNGLSLYAVWVKAETGVTMQTFNSNSSPYSTMSNGSVIALTDIRDDDTYAVAKLADGEWWMIENLRLDYDANITASNTQSYNSGSSNTFGGVFTGLAEPESPWANDSTTANSLYSNDGSTTATISGNNLAYRFPRYNNQNTDSNSRIQSNYTNSGNVYSYGNYYTWPAAVADTENYTTNNQSTENTSLCPTGWHLPKGGNNQNTANNEFLAYSEALIGAKPANYSQTQPYYTGNPEGYDASDSIRSYPNNFLYSGNVYSSSVSNSGSIGGYWSSTVRGSSRSYLLSLTSSGVFPGTSSSNKYYGFSVRCAAGS